MNDDTVLVATARLDEATRRLVTDACEHARVRPVFWGAAGPESSNGPLNPTLLIAALPTGYRNIPEDLSTLATQVYQALPLLLLCGEPLVRNSVSLQGGRVTLLGQPLTRDKISARIRTAVAGTAAAVADSGRPVGDDRGARVREMRGREWWAGVIARDPEREHRSPDAGDLLPTVCKLGRHGVAGLIALNGHDPMPAPAFQQAALGLASGLPLDRAAAALETALGADAAAVWFSPATYQWSFYSPRPETELWLYSPLRLPSAWRLSMGAGSWRTLGAASGDVIVMMSGEPSGPLSAADIKAGEVWRVAEGGGPALLDHFEARYATWTGVGATLIMELR